MFDCYLCHWNVYSLCQTMLIYYTRFGDTIPIEISWFVQHKIPSYAKDIEMILAFYLASSSSGKKYDGSGFSIFATSARGIGQFVMMIIDCLNLF